MSIDTQSKTRIAVLGFQYSRRIVQYPFLNLVLLFQVLIYGSCSAIIIASIESNSKVQAMFDLFILCYRTIIVCLFIRILGDKLNQVQVRVLLQAFQVSLGYGLVQGIEVLVELFSLLPSSYYCCIYTYRSALRLGCTLGDI